LPPDSAAPDKADQLIAISLENPASFTKAIEAFKRWAADGDPAMADQLFTKRAYLGQTLYTVTPPPLAPVNLPGFSYAIANRTFLLGIGSPATVEAALQGMAEKRDSFWNKPEVKAALADVPSTSPGIQVQDARVLLGGIFETLDLIPAPLQIVDPSAKLDAQQLGRYWGMMSGYVVRDATSFFSVSRIAHPQP
jgi:hypothetical protein